MTSDQREASTVFTSSRRQKRERLKHDLDKARYQAGNATLPPLTRSGSLTRLVDRIPEHNNGGTAGVDIIRGRGGGPSSCPHLLFVSFLFHLRRRSSLLLSFWANDPPRKVSTKQVSDTSCCPPCSPLCSPASVDSGWRPSAPSPPAWPPAWPCPSRAYPPASAACPSPSARPTRDQNSKPKGGREEEPHPLVSTCFHKQGLQPCQHECCTMFTPSRLVGDIQSMKLATENPGRGASGGQELPRHFSRSFSAQHGAKHEAPREGERRDRRKKKCNSWMKVHTTTPSLLWLLQLAGAAACPAAFNNQ